MVILDIDSVSRNFVVDYVKENWGSQLVVTKGKVYNTEELPGFVAVVDGEMQGIVTYNIDEKQCEIVTLGSMIENKGIGCALIEEVVKKAKTEGCKRVWLVTTNDNIHALRFYQKRGFDITAIHRNSIVESRKIKPQIPLKGYDDIPMLHEIEFEKMI